MSTERKEELAALHALGLLEDAERTAFESEIARDPALRVLVDELAGTAAALALAAPPAEPPAALKERILGSVAAEERANPAPRPAGNVVAFPLLRLIPWLAAACFAFGAGWLFMQNTELRRANDDLRTEKELAEAAYQVAQNQLTERTVLAERMITDLGRRLQRQEDLTRLKVTALAALVPENQDAQAIAVWDPEIGAGLLTVDKLPALAPTQDYQIWVVDPAYPTPVDGGVFSPGPDGRAAVAFKGDKPVRTVNAFAISVEKKGGVPKAEGPIVLLGK